MQKIIILELEPLAIKLHKQDKAFSPSFRTVDKLCNNHIIFRLN